MSCQEEEDLKAGSQRVGKERCCLSHSVVRQSQAGKGVRGCRESKETSSCDGECVCSSSCESECECLVWETEYDKEVLLLDESVPGGLEPPASP